MKGHKDLTVWQKAMDFVLKVYKATKTYPRDEVFGLVSQMRRAAVSIPSNIAEGYGRIHQRETENFLGIALGSACELETQLILSKDLGYLQIEEVRQLINEVQEIIRMLTSLIKSLSNTRQCSTVAVNEQMI